MSAKKAIIFLLILIPLSGCSLFNREQSDGEQQSGSDNLTEPERQAAGENRLGDFYVSLRSPQAGQILKSPFLVGGQADLPEDLVYVRVKNYSGDVLIEEQVKTKGAGGPFSILLNFRFQSTAQGEVEVFGRDQAGEEISVQTVPVRFDVVGGANSQTIP